MTFPAEMTSREVLNEVADAIHEQNRRWWTDLYSGAPIERNVGELLMLCVSELGEALEGHRKGLRDDHLPHRSSLEVELADCVIRIFDMASGLGYSIGDAIEEKLAYNAQRKDHTAEGRKAAGGKAY